MGSLPLSIWEKAATFSPRVCLLSHPGAQGHTGRVETCFCGRYYWVLHRFRTLFNLLPRDGGVQPCSFQLAATVPLRGQSSPLTRHGRFTVPCPIWSHPRLQLTHTVTEVFTNGNRGKRWLTSECSGIVEKMKQIDEARLSTDTNSSNVSVRINTRLALVKHQALC